MSTEATYGIIPTNQSLRPPKLLCFESSSSSGTNVIVVVTRRVCITNAHPIIAKLAVVLPIIMIVVRAVAALAATTTVFSRTATAATTTAFSRTATSASTATGATTTEFLLTSTVAIAIIAPGITAATIPTRNVAITTTMTLEPFSIILIGGLEKEF